MKIISCLSLFNGHSSRCIKTVASSVSTAPKSVPQKVSNAVATKVEPGKDCFLRADKVMSQEFYNKAIQQKTVHDVYKNALLPQKDFMAVLKKYLSKLVATENNPDLPIKSIKGSVKKADKIIEKLQSIGSYNPNLVDVLNTPKGIKENISDIVRARIILRSGAKEDTREILKALSKAHKNGEFKIIEAEVYTPVVENMSDEFIKLMEKQLGKKMTIDDFYHIISDREYFSYVGSKDLNAFAKNCSIAKPKVKNLPTGYTAVHLGIMLPEGYKAELQIMGCNVEALKEIEDVYYKAKCGKKIPEELIERFAPLMPKTSNQEVQELMAQYTRDAYLRERLKADKRFNSRVDTEFLVAPQELLDLGLGFNQTAPLIRKVKKS